jgi:hypothetical protein
LSSRNDATTARQLWQLASDRSEGAISQNYRALRPRRNGKKSRKTAKHRRCRVALTARTWRQGQRRVGQQPGRTTPCPWQRTRMPCTARRSARTAAVSTHFCPTTRPATSAHGSATVAATSYCQYGHFYRDRGYFIVNKGVRTSLKRRKMHNRICESATAGGNRPGPPQAGECRPWQDGSGLPSPPLPAEDGRQTGKIHLIREVERRQLTRGRQAPY